MLVLEFFRRLKSTSRALFWVCGTVVAVQLVLTALKISAAPFLLYGMFSETPRHPLTITRHQVLVGSLPLDSVGMPVRERQLLEGALRHYLTMKKSSGSDPVRDQLSQRSPEMIKRLMGPDGPLKGMFNDPAALPQFEDWFREKCETIAGSRYVDRARNDGREHGVDSNNTASLDNVIGREDSNNIDSTARLIRKTDSGSVNPPTTAGRKTRIDSIRIIESTYRIDPNDQSSLILVSSEQVAAF